MPEALREAEDSRPSGPVSPMENRTEEKFVESCMCKEGSDLL